MNDLATMWIEAVGAKGCWLIGDREDSPQERKRLADELRRKMLVESGIANVRDDEIQYQVVDKSPQLLRAFRERLIEEFRGRQSTACEYLSFVDVAKHWGPLRKESNLKDQKAGAMADLMEAVFDGDIQEVLFLHPKSGVEFVIGAAPWLNRPKHPLHDLSKRDEGTAKFGSGDIDRQVGVLPRDEMEAYFLAEMAPHFWARREAVVAQLNRSGVDRAALPARWVGSTTVTGVTVEAEKATKKGKSNAGRKEQYDWVEGRQFFEKLMADMGDLDDRPDWSTQTQIVERLMHHMQKFGNGMPGPSSANDKVKEWLAIWRAKSSN
jgi:hypothetical protein